MKKRKLLAVLLSSVMVAALAGCGETASVPETSSIEDSDTAKSAAPSGSASDAGESSNKLTIWCIDDSNQYAAEQAGIIFAEDHPGFEVEVVPYAAGDLEVAMTNAGASGDYSQLPDIVQSQDYSFNKWIDNYPDMLADLTDSGIDFSVFTSGKLGNSIVRGRNYGVPIDNGVAIGAWRTDYLEEAGYTIEDLTDITWNRFSEIGADVFKKTGHPMFVAVGAEPQVICMMLTSAGSSFFNEDGTPNVAENDVLKEAVKMYAEMVKNGTIEEVQDWEQFNAAITTGHAVGALNGCWCLNTVNKAEVPGVFRVTNIPRLDVPGGTNYSFNGGSSWAVIDSSPNKQLACDYLGATFGGSTELYSKIIEKGLVACYKPAINLPEYQEGAEYYGGQVVYATLLEYADKIPQVHLGEYYYDGIQAMGVAASNVIQNGADIDKELEDAQETLEFNLNL